MESKLIIKYHIYDVLGNYFETDWHSEAEASFDEGKIVYEVHETTWSVPWTSGKNIVYHEWYQQ